MARREDGRRNKNKKNSEQYVEKAARRCDDGDATLGSSRMFSLEWRRTSSTSSSASGSFVSDTAAFAGAALPPLRCFTIGADGNECRR